MNSSFSPAFPSPFPAGRRSRAAGVLHRGQAAPPTHSPDRAAPAPRPPSGAAASVPGRATAAATTAGRAPGAAPADLNYNFNPNFFDNNFPFSVLDYLIENFIIIGNKNKIVSEIISFRRDRKLDSIL